MTEPPAPWKSVAGLGPVEIQGYCVGVVHFSADGGKMDHVPAGFDQIAPISRLSSSNMPGMSFVLVPNLDPFGQTDATTLNLNRP